MAIAMIPSTAAFTKRESARRCRAMLMIAGGASAQEFCRNTGAALEGFPLAYEVLPGNTADKTTLGDFLKKIEDQYGKAQRIWIMDRGIPTEEVLSEMRKSQPPVYYLVGTPKGRLGHLEKDLAQRAWETVRQGVEVKLLAQEGELYVLAQSRDRVCKEGAIGRRQLKKLWKRLKQLQAMKLSAKDLLLKLGEARGHYRAAWRLIDFELPKPSRNLKNPPAFASPSTAKSSAIPAVAKAVICCAATFAKKTPLCSGAFTPC